MIEGSTLDIITRIRISILVRIHQKILRSWFMNSDTQFNTTNTTCGELVRLNPWLVGGFLPRGRHRLVLPEGSPERFDDRLVSWEQANPEPERVYYLVRRGDTLGAIARNHGVSLRALLEWNDLTSRSIIRPGQEIMIQQVD